MQTSVQNIFKTQKRKNVTKKVRKRGIKNVDVNYVQPHV